VPIVLNSFGTLERVGGRATSLATDPVRSAGLDFAGPATYAAIYRTQPHVRTVIDFIARNVAQVGLHVYRRISDTDRARLATHELAVWLNAPNPDTTAYRLKEVLMQDLGIFGMAYWAKVRMPDRIGLVRMPPDAVVPHGWLLPTSYDWIKPDYSVITLSATDVVAFRYFNPDDPLTGLSTLETLRQLLAEDGASLTYRRAFWQNAARLEGVVTRPSGLPKWTPEQKQSFREQWQARYAGAPGQTAVLEDGMTFTPTSFSARDSEFTAARKLTREEVASAFHVPLPMVGILDHATFSNIREQHKNLYQDCLGPSLEMITQEIERQLLVESDDTQDVYVEANIADKLKGSFEEQANALRVAVGRPWMTANEGRARMNLPSIKGDPGADELATPLNLSTPSGTVDDPSTIAPTPAARVLPFSTTSLAPLLTPVIRATWDRQQARLEKVDPVARAASFVSDRWDRELAADLEAAYRQAGISPAIAAQAGATLAATINAETLQLLVQHEEAFGAAREAALYV
jgi:HK97 family phage portal protein